MNPYSRTEFLLGKAAMDKLKKAKVAVFGLGGVGGYVVEVLARSGIGALDLVDHDTISQTNINRQILATVDTVGMDKTEAAAKRVKAINPDIQVRGRKTSLRAMADQYTESAKDPENGLIYISHGDCLADAESLAAMIKEKHGAGVQIITDVGPVIGAHSGPGTLALFFLAHKR